MLREYLLAVKSIHFYVTYLFLSLNQSIWFSCIAWPKDWTHHCQETTYALTNCHVSWIIWWIHFWALKMVFIYILRLLRTCMLILSVILSTSVIFCLLCWWPSYFLYTWSAMRDINALSGLQPFNVPSPLPLESSWF